MNVFQHNSLKERFNKALEALDETRIFTCNTIDKFNNINFFLSNCYSQ
jgi:hypothetical protein